MRELTCQIRHSALLPFSEEDKAELSNFHDNQIVRVRVAGTTKIRSLVQLRAFWRAAKIVAENTDDKQWNEKNKVAFQVKVTLHFVDPTMVAVRPDGTVVFQYRSISFANLKHLEACHFFTRAFDIMAAKIGVPVETFVKNAEAG